MIILDKPYVSEEMKHYLDQSQTPVLQNAVAIEENEGHSFHLLSEEAFAEQCNNGNRVYTLSENSLAWITKHLKDPVLMECIRLMKDKAAFRERLSSLYPAFYFQRVKLRELQQMKLNEEQFPLILKPAVGFFSVGVYTITNQEDWDKALEDIAANYNDWGRAFPDSVVDSAEFIIEQYIKGDEFAVDAYFDSKGKAVVLNVLRHEFASVADVSDRLYYTSKEIIRQYAQQFEDYLDEVNRLLGVSNFPFHAEVRITERGEIIPIEFNPLRFAGWCCTDLSYFAYGFYAYDYYLNNRRPDWKQLLEGKDDQLFTLIVLDKTSNYAPEDLFDYDRLQEDFKKILCLRKLNYKEGKPFAFLFTETARNNKQELQNIMHSDLSEYRYR